MLKLGDKVRRVPLTFTDTLEKIGSHYMEGIVVFVHPEGRFHTVEFALGRGRKARECFPGVER